jgi:hypothetical protein
MGPSGIPGTKGNLGYTGSTGAGYVGSRGSVGYTGSSGNIGLGSLTNVVISDLKPGQFLMFDGQNWVNTDL